jgi:hypothetical protein
LKSKKKKKGRQIFEKKWVVSAGQSYPLIAPMIPDGNFVGELPNSYAIEDGSDYCWISGKTHKFEWPNGTTKPEWNGLGDVVGCGLVLNPAKELSLFFIGNGILMGQSLSLYDS